MEIDRRAIEADTPPEHGEDERRLEDTRALEVAPAGRTALRGLLGVEGLA